MKGLFKSKPRTTPADLVHHLRHLLPYTAPNPVVRILLKLTLVVQIRKVILEMRTEFFKEDTCYMLIEALPDLDPGTRQDVTHVIANLQRQRLNGRYLASEYLECNTSLLAMLLPGCDDSELAISHGAILRECIRHQVAAKHKSTVAEFLSKNYDWFFQEYNTLLESPNYISRRNAVMDSNKTIQLEAFHVFKLFPANQRKPQEIVNVLIANRSKLIRFFSDFTFEKADEQFESDKAEVVKEIATLELKCQPCSALKQCEEIAC
ncbi:hypothetical protein L1987_49422 [Smallanthus sonchifolius]|uniref:Uncharacterized protein n=1 Tax=Smallanthus sonchifolius TaxID=185202 RepID=A0ACB9FUN8_9ASTR|nr:hypothetical protein L1987_49422 [Smallanthus sonchifolius]